MSGDDGQKQELQPIVQAARKVKAKVCAVEAKIQLTEQVIDDCATVYHKMFATNNFREFHK